MRRKKYCKNEELSTESFLDTLHKRYEKLTNEEYLTLSGIFKAICITVKDFCDKFIGTPYVRVDNKEPLCYHKDGKSMVKTQAKTKKKRYKIRQDRVYSFKCLETELMTERIFVGKIPNQPMPCVSFCNVLRDKPTQIQWVLDNFGDMVEQSVEMWVKFQDKAVMETAKGMLHEHDFDVYLERPIIMEGVTHFLNLYSDDLAVLRYIEFEARKHLETIDNLNSTLSEGGRYKETIAPTNREEELRLFCAMLQKTKETVNTDKLIAEGMDYYFTDPLMKKGRELGLSEKEIRALINQYFKKSG